MSFQPPSNAAFLGVLKFIKDTCPKGSEFVDNVRPPWRAARHECSEWGLQWSVTFVHFIDFQKFMLLYLLPFPLIVHFNVRRNTLSSYRAEFVNAIRKEMITFKFQTMAAIQSGQVRAVPGVFAPSMQSPERFARAYGFDGYENCHWKKYGWCLARNPEGEGGGHVFKDLRELKEM